MTRKDYKLLADAIKSCNNPGMDSAAKEIIRDLIGTLSQSLKADNSLFNAETFRAACEASK